jgi:diadenosine tetraphosphate (Ap4A) HIT family hydrolase
MTNASPLCEGHSLLIPEKARILPQYVSSAELLEIGLAFLASLEGEWALGYNSVGAFSSVNHFHFHVFPQKIMSNWFPNKSGAHRHGYYEATAFGSTVEAFSLIDEF